MNSLKNLIIIGVLAAVGYGVYASLQRNNIDSEQPFAAPKVDLSGAKPSSSRSLPLSESSIPPLGGTSLGSGGLAAPTAPPLAPPLVSAPGVNPPANAPGASPAVPLPSSSSAANSLVPPALSPPASPPAGLTSNPAATLGAPVPPEPNPSTTSPNPITSTQEGPVLRPETSTPPTGVVRNLAAPPDVSPLDGGNPPKNAASDTRKQTDSSLQSTFDAWMEAVQKTLHEGKLAEAQHSLSVMYVNPDLPADQAKQITDLLDQLAGTVIYSRQHYLSPPYRTQAGDTIDTVAQKYNVPWQLLAKINGLMPPGAASADTATKDLPLPVGKELKVLQGPFDAIIQLEKRELTLMVQDRYAGRFPIGVGRDQPKLEGEYTIGTKMLNPTYYGPDGINIGPNDPKNPLGGAWIGLTDRIGIHGTADPQSIGRDNNRGTICVSDRDLQDLYGILSVGSRVTIMR